MTCKNIEYVREFSNSKNLPLTLHLQMKENTMSAAVSYSSADSSCPDMRSRVCWENIIYNYSLKFIVFFTYVAVCYITRVDTCQDMRSSVLGEERRLNTI